MAVERLSKYFDKHQENVKVRLNKLEEIQGIESKKISGENCKLEQRDIQIVEVAE